VLLEEALHAVMEVDSHGSRQVFEGEVVDAGDTLRQLLKLIDVWPAQLRHLVARQRQEEIWHAVGMHQCKQVLQGLAVVPR
jgi:hypothetical protein